MLDIFVVFRKVSDKFRRTFSDEADLLIANLKKRFIRYLAHKTWFR
jgi:hypothetical protein